MCDSEENLVEIISFLIESSSDSEDENIEDYLYFIKKENTFEYMKPKTTSTVKKYLNLDIKNIPLYTESEFKNNFRISIDLFTKLCDKFTTSAVYNCLRADKRLPARVYIAVFLWFSGNSCSFRQLSHHFKLSLSTISRMIELTSYYISTLAPEFIKWPDEKCKQRASRMYAIKSGLSKAIGCIGMTHIQIEKPYNDKDDFEIGESNFSVCLQAVCDEQKKFTDIFVGFPSTENQLLKKSPLYNKLPSYCGDYYLIGNSSYECNKYLITPYNHNKNLKEAQKHFNIKLNEGHKSIEQAFRMLKQRFKHLYICKLRGIDKIRHFITSLCVLHNMADESDHIFTQEEFNSVIFSNIVNAEEVDYNCGNEIRNVICEEMKNKLNKCRF